MRHDHRGNAGRRIAGIRSLLLLPIAGCIAGVSSAQSAAPAVAGGFGHALLLRTDGTVRAWGWNSSGQLGDGTITNAATPVAVSGLNGVVAVAAGASHSLALRNDGTVWAWGQNSAGQIGNGFPGAIPVTVPVQVTGLTGIVAIAAGEAHNLALRGDGSVWAWGFNGFGQSGGPPMNGSVPATPVAGIGGVVAVAAGAWHSLALRGDGTVWSWGANGSGQLGNGTAGGSSGVPAAVPGLGGVVSLAAGTEHSLAVLGDGTLRAFGRNDVGQLGNAAAGAASPVAVTVNGVSGVVAAAARGHHALAILADGTVQTFGANEAGQLGNGATGGSSAAPAPVLGLSAIVAAAAGYQCSFAVQSDGTVWTFGLGFYGQLGNGMLGGSSTTPVPVFGLAGVVAAEGGSHFSLAVRNDGTVWAWGFNGYGQLGIGASNPYSTFPVQVPGLGGIVAAAAGFWHGLALGSDGTVRAWGVNYSGQLGIGTMGLSVNTPVPVPGLSGIVAVAAGRNHSVALRNDGSVWTWGSNDAGQLGVFTTGGISLSPAPVPALGGIVAIAAGYDHVLAVQSNGTVWAWGSNVFDQIGVATGGFPANAPTTVPGLGGAVAVAAGYHHSLAVRSDGSLWTWGRNNFGQIGNGTVGFSAQAPAAVTGLGAVAAAAADGYFSLAVRSDGSVWAFGDNSQGQLGNGAAGGYSTSPGQVLGLGVAVAAAAGALHSLALRNDGTAWGFGSGLAGQLGNGSPAPQPTTAAVNAGSSLWLNVLATAMGDWMLSLTGIPPAAAAGFTGLSATLPPVPGQGPVFGIVPDALTLAALQLFPAPAAGNPFHWIAGVPGVFPAAPLAVPAAVMTPFAGQTWDLVALVYGPGVLAGSNVWRVAW